MTVWVAFLRGVNLGKRQMPMADLRACCEAIGLDKVKTILASGNVRFETGIPAARLKQRLEQALETRFSFPVKVILRRAAEITRMFASDPFAEVDAQADVALHVLLADQPLLPQPDLAGLPGHIEVPRIDAREIYFVAHRLPNGRYTEGLDQFQRQLPGDALVTMRNWNTMKKVLG